METLAPPGEEGGGPPLPAPLLLQQGVLVVQAEQAAHLHYMCFPNFEVQPIGRKGKTICNHQIQEGLKF